MSPNDALSFAVAERRLHRRLDELERGLSVPKVDLNVGWIIALASMNLLQAVAVASLAVAILR